MKRKAMFVLLLLGLAWWWWPTPGPQQRPLLVFSGETMGTSYEVKIAGWMPGSAEDVGELREALEAELEQVNASMSTYRPESEISRFNRMESTDVVELSEGFREVLALSLRVGRETSGAFDPTLDPLINLWGFGHQGRPEREPDDAALQAARERTGLDKLELGPDGLRKRHPQTAINLSAVAKGYGVDRLSALLSARGHVDHYVEIGGEVRCRGRNARHEVWRIGIQKPVAESGIAAETVVSLADLAMATSGDYRNLRAVEGGGWVAHILDPRSGRPVGHAVASVSVIADTCAEADALATALYVMGDEEGLAWADTRTDIGVLYLVRSPEGFHARGSAGWQAISGSGSPGSDTGRN